MGAYTTFIAEKFLSYISACLGGKQKYCYFYEI